MKSHHLLPNLLVMSSPLIISACDDLQHAQLSSRHIQLQDTPSLHSAIPQSNEEAISLLPNKICAKENAESGR